MTVSAAPPQTATTRDRLIDAAFRVVARDGLEAASVKTVAAEAGITPGLVHYHFSNKDKMIEAALRRGLGDYIARSRARREATPPQRQIELFFDNARATFAPDRDFFKVRLALAVRAMTHPDLAAVMTDINTAAISEVAQVFALAADRTAPTDRDIALAATLKAAFDGIMLAWINDPAFPVQAAGEILEQAATNWVEQP